MAIGLGFGFGFGDLYTSFDRASASLNPSLGENMSGQVPISLGLGYRPLSLLSFGIAFTHAPIWVKDCSSSCSMRDERVVAEARLHLLSERPLSPWLALGVGYEFLSYQRDNGYIRAGLSGYQLELQGGGDVRVGRSVTIGPYVGIAIGVYGHYNWSASYRGALPVSTDIPSDSRATHGWLSFGIRGTFTPSAL